MARIGFIGLGNMGAPMARNLLKAGHEVRVFDIDGAAVGRLAREGATAAADAAAAARGADFCFAMLPTGREVRQVMLGEDGLLAALAGSETIVVDCSTIDVASALAAHDAAAASRVAFIDAPVTGGMPGAAAGTLTFMCGGSDNAVARAEPVLLAMGRAVVRAGGPGAGQAAKICNNLAAGVAMVAISEAFALGRAFGLADQTLYDVMRQGSGQCWALTSYCPAPGPVPAAPSNRGYAPGFAIELMIKDLRLAESAAGERGVAIPLAAATANLYELHRRNGGAGRDFSSIFEMLRPGPP